MGDIAPDKALQERRGGKIGIEMELPQNMALPNNEEYISQYEQLIRNRIQNGDIPSSYLAQIGFRDSASYKTISRIMDIAIPVLGLILLLPLFPMIAILIKLNSRGPVFYKQERVGLHGQIFTLWKFRTMVSDAEKDTGAVWAKVNDNRITLVGKFLRKTRFDELAQLYNVIKGEMSFIGPRPERPCFVSQFIDQIPGYAQRLMAKPGITGWAQVNANYDRDINDVKVKLKYDLYYIENRSILLDIKILLKTFPTVLTGNGAH